ncbi:MAG: hypothetical protein HKN85_07020 [Gammaproteobacteria bacterium]|nr:hypothetical protein [Gammaproteobacteria bacterium]
MQRERLTASSYLLLSANLVPLIGVLFFNWDAVLVLALFWMENLLIGFFNLVKITAVSFLNKELSGLSAGAFFFVHYGAFCAAHGLLLMDLLDYSIKDTAELFNINSAGVFTLYLEGAAVFFTLTRDLAPLIWYGLAGLVISRLGSFVENFILNGEIFSVKARQLMAQPYSQIIVMHIGLLLGAVLLQRFGSPVWLLASLVILKVIIDFTQFRRRHTRVRSVPQQINDI